MADGPDFLCIGLQKAGTGWLYDQLQFHPDFWMPPIKEIHYLDRPFSQLGKSEKFLRFARKPERWGHKFMGRRPWDERDVEFLKLYAGFEDKPMGLRRYASLF